MLGIDDTFGSPGQRRAPTTLRALASEKDRLVLWRGTLARPRFMVGLAPDPRYADTSESHEISAITYNELLALGVPERP
jgi:hypothetical protein